MNPNSLMLRIRIARLFATVIVIAPLILSGLGWSSVVTGPSTTAAVLSVNSDRQASEAILNSIARKLALRLARLAPPLPEKGPFKSHNVTLAAALAPGSEPLSDGLSWRILKLDQSNRTHELIWSGAGAGPELTLKPGRYYAEATYGLAKNGSEFEVLPDKGVAPVVSLNAGTLHVHGAAIGGGPPLEGMFFTLRKADAAPDSEDGEIGRSSQPQAVFHVPEGQYRLIAQHGLAAIEMPVTVSPGENKPVEAVMNSATLTLSAHAKSDGPMLSGATFLIYENGEAGRNREIVRSKLGEPTFNLPAGHYRIAAVLGLAQVEEDIIVKPGEQLKRSLALDAGGVRLSSSLAGNGSPLDRHLLYRIFTLSTEGGKTVNQEILTSTLPSPTIFLPRGRYRIESQYGWHNARQTREIEVKAGEVINIDFEHKASDVKLRLVPKPGGEAIDRVKWTLKYNGGGTVLISQDAAPTLILQAGHYQAMAQHEAKTYTQTFEAISNREQVVEVVLQ